MRWTYQEYMEQPSWFVQLLIEKLRYDAKEAKRLHGKNAKHSHYR